MSLIKFAKNTHNYSNYKLEWIVYKHTVFHVMKQTDNIFIINITGFYFKTKQHHPLFW